MRVSGNARERKFRSTAEYRQYRARSPLPARAEGDGRRITVTDTVTGSDAGPGQDQYRQERRPGRDLPGHIQISEGKSRTRLGFDSLLEANPGHAPDLAKLGVKRPPRSPVATWACTDALGKSRTCAGFGVRADCPDLRGSARPPVRIGRPDRDPVSGTPHAGLRTGLRAVSGNERFRTLADASYV